MKPWLHVFGRGSDCWEQIRRRGANSSDTTSVLLAIWLKRASCFLEPISGRWYPSLRLPDPAKNPLYERFIHTANEGRLPGMEVKSARRYGRSRSCPS